MIIDAHLHISLNDWTEQRLLNYMDQHGIQKGWILTWDEQTPVAPMYYQSLDIDEVRKAFKNHPDRIVPFYAPDPGRPDWKERLSACLDEGFAGCGELKVSYRWNDPRVIQLMEFLDQKKLPLIFHMEQGREMFIPRKESGADWLFKRLINERFNGRSAHLIRKTQEKTGLFNRYLESRMMDFPGYLMDLDLLEAAVKNYTGITFIAHGPHIWNHFSVPVISHLFIQKGRINGRGRLWELLEKYDNFNCDISGYTCYTALNRDENFTREFLEKNYRKVLFGTDNWELGLKEMLERLSPAEEKMEFIMYRNAASITSPNS